MTPWDLLGHLKNALAAVSGVATCQIGLEANITPADYPLVRLVPTRLTPHDEVGDRAKLELTVYFGAALLESADGLETVYEELLRMEEAIRQAVLFGAVKAAWQAGARMTARHVDTLFDEDRLPHYKMMAGRFEVEG